MKYQLHFTVPTFAEEFDVFPIPENYDYWVPLMRKFIEQSDTIEIHCWNDEKDIIKETTLLFKDSSESEVVNGRDITIIKGSKTEDISNHLLYKTVKINGKLKWFSIFLNRNKTALFHSEHWGTEFFAPNLSEEDIAYIKSVTPKETNFNQYK